MTKELRAELHELINTYNSPIWSDEQAHRGIDAIMDRYEARLAVEKDKIEYGGPKDSNPDHALPWYRRP